MKPESTVMSTEHTPGPWETPGEDGGERVICASPKGKRITISHVYDGHKHGSMEPNARRIVACVNACEGMSNESLTELQGPNLARDYSRMETERDALRAQVATRDADLRAMDAYNVQLRAQVAELRTALHNVIDRGTVLSDWMRNMTGPHDGTLSMLTDWHECVSGIIAALGAAK